MFQLIYTVSHPVAILILPLPSSPPSPPPISYWPTAHSGLECYWWLLRRKRDVVSWSRCRFRGNKPLPFREHALGFYTQACNTELMCKAYFLLERFDELESLSESLPFNHPLLPVSLVYCVHVLHKPVCIYSCDSWWKDFISFSGFGDKISFQIWPNFPFGAWTIYSPWGVKK